MFETNTVISFKMLSANQKFAHFSFKLSEIAESLTIY